MSHDWKELKLGEILEVKYGKDHKNLLKGNIPVYGSGGIMRHVNTYMYDDESILIPRKGTLSNIFYRSEPFWTVDTMFWTKINKSRVVPKFLYYQLRTIDFNIMNVGSAVPSLTVPVINDIDILLPSLPEQKSIAEVLSSLDDKIDLLHQQNKTLEALAETLFRQSFVEEAESYTTLSYYVKVVAGYAFKSSDFKEEGNNRVIKITNIDFESVDVSKTQFINVEINTKLSKYVIPAGSFVIAMTGAEIGKIGMVPTSSKPLLLNQRVGLLVDNVPGGSILGYLFLRSIDGQDFIVNEASGSAQPNISTNGIESMKVPQIEREQLQKLTAELTSLYDKKLENLNQIRQLETLRDTLLPKLMSGAVRVN